MAESHEVSRRGGEQVLQVTHDGETVEAEKQTVRETVDGEIVETEKYVVDDEAPDEVVAEVERVNADRDGQEGGSNGEGE